MNDAAAAPKTLDKLAAEYGTAIGDVIPRDTNFILLVYKPGDAAQVARNEAGIAYVTSSEAGDAVKVVRGFLAMIDAAVDAARAR